MFPTQKRALAEMDSLRSSYRIVMKRIKRMYLSTPARALVALMLVLSMGTGIVASASLTPEGFTFISAEEVAESDPATTEKEEMRHGLTATERAEKIDEFFRSKGNLPLAGYGMDFVVAADEYGIDWRLLPAIGFIESTGGKFACNRVSYSAFGWGSCRINFDSYEASIDIISRHLGGHEPNTAHFYAGKDTFDILQTYNPPHIVETYAQQVMRVMDQISRTQ